MAPSSRRNFLKQSMLATAGTMLVPQFLKAFEKNAAFLPSDTNRKLVIVQLSGGNDGLNTIVPYQNDIYYRERPALSIPKEKVLRINDEIGFNPAMAPLQDVFEKGLMTIINNVGYPNPDRSHFRSMDIWHSASNADTYQNTGWIGRYLDAQCTNHCLESYHALEVDDTLSLALKGEKVKGLAVSHPQKFFKQVHNRQFEQLAAMPVSPNEPENVSYLYKTLAETVSSADYIYENWQNGGTKRNKSRISYPDTELGRRLKTLSELILSGVETQVFYVSLSGFDTHANQADRQNRLLSIYAEAMNAFTRDLEENNLIDEVMIMTFSEFGRRVKQNASNGTDHGTANNVFLINGRLKKGRVYNEAPDLSNLDEGDLKHTVDFRQIYATLIRKWLKTDDAAILGGKFDPLGFV
jgi:uncharacterized protein (DUF1501 family)